MKLRKIAEDTDFSAHEEREPLVVGDYYNMIAVDDVNADGRKIPVFVMIGFTDEGIAYKRYYSPLSPEAHRLKIRVLGMEEDNVQYVRARFIADVDTKFARYDRAHKDFFRDDNDDPIVLTLKDIPELHNLDLYTADEFFDRFNRIKGKFDHGLVGHILDLNNLVPIDGVKKTAPSGNSDESTVRNKFEDFDDMTKLDKAISIYKSFRAYPRKEVVEKFEKMLNMTKNGASSYYTKVHNIVEKD